MYLNTIQANILTSNRILLLTEEQKIQEDVRLSSALQHMDNTRSSSAALGDAMKNNQAKPENTPLDLVCTASEKEALFLVESAAQEHKPFSVVFMDGRLFYGKNVRLLIKRLWQIQGDLHLVLHSAPQLESFEQIPIELGSNHQLLVFKFRLIPFEITQLIRTLTTKRNINQQTSARHMNLSAQLLEVTTRFEDVSSRLRVEQDHNRQLETRLCRSQRLETAGRFADAMSHFFNDYLTVIQSHLEIALPSQAGGSGALSSLQELHIATKRAAGVSAQFVAFNRRKYLQPEPMRLEKIITEQTDLLQQAVGEEIAIHINHKPGLPCVMADLASIEQMIINLLIHARAAMPQGGKLMIQTRQLTIPDAAAAQQVHEDAKPGSYVGLTISDTGKGMTHDELALLFDTSRLSSDHEGDADIALILVQGLARLQGGWISAKSVMDVGTEFSIYLPIANETGPTLARPDKKSLITHAKNDTSTILIVDDEESVRQVMEYVLTSQGHKVLIAENASEAWSLWRTHAASIHLVITDIQLPGGSSGFDLEHAIAETDATLPVIFTCGYCPNNLKNVKELKTGENFLPKPFGMVELLNIVGHALTQPVRI